jgi:hypothetical protein
VTDLFNIIKFSVMKKIKFTLFIALIMFGNVSTNLYSQESEKKMVESKMKTQTSNWLRSSASEGDGEDITPPGEPGGADWGAPISDGLLVLSLLSCGYLLFCVARRNGQHYDRRRGLLGRYLLLT